MKLLCEELKKMNKEAVQVSRKKKERLNELDGKTWERYSISIWDIVKSKDEIRLHHPAMFPMELCQRLIEIYTRKGDVILDPFMGSGSAIIVARDMERKGIGFEINPEFVNLAKRRLSQQKLVQLTTEEPDIYCEDAINLLKYVKPSSVDLVITSPPYWNIHTRKRTADYKRPRPYSTLERDLGNISDYDTFMRELKAIFEKVHFVLKHGKRCVIIVMDIRQGSQFYPFHMSVCNMMKETGFVLEDIIIWDRRKEYSNLRPLGFPYVFIVNKVHEYILIFRKDKVEGIEEALS
jgi:DNA modification methylase